MIFDVEREFLNKMSREDLIELIQKADGYGVRIKISIGVNSSSLGIPVTRDVKDGIPDDLGIFLEKMNDKYRIKE